VGARPYLRRQPTSGQSFLERFLTGVLSDLSLCLAQVCKMGFSAESAAACLRITQTWYGILTSRSLVIRSNISTNINFVRFPAPADAPLGGAVRYRNSLDWR
jgi:hypothetical protein